MNTDRDEYWMMQALQLARRAYELGEVPVGAVLVLDDKLVAEGWNRPIVDRDPTAHAEIVAIRQACQVLDNYRIPSTTLYVTIEPCTMCLGAIIHARIGRVVFGAPEPKAGAIQSHSDVIQSGVFNHTIEYRGGVCETECSSLIQEFFQMRRNEKKAQKSLKN